MHSIEEKKVAFERLLNIMDDLRTKCPWDMKQTMDSLRHLTIEETYELTDAIMKNDLQEVKKELGDLMLHMVFYARIASETNDFDIADVLHGVCEKLISRHPHIYGDVKVENAEDVKKNWEQLKLKEGNKSVLSGVPESMPSVIKAMRMQEKAAQVGFDWPDIQSVWGKVQEELHEFEAEVAAGHASQKEAEMGDLLFSLINYCRHAGMNPDTALERTNAKFRKRFMYMEEQVKATGKQLSDLKLEEMDQYWNEAKNI